MYNVSVQGHFSAAHSLREYEGKCEALHGHNWQVEVSVSSEELDKIGMVVDFKIVKKALKEVSALLDHKHLNEVEYFKTTNPTSENIAKFIFDQLKNEIRDTRYEIREVSVWETPNSKATYSE